MAILGRNYPFCKSNLLKNRLFVRYSTSIPRNCP